MEPRPTGDWFHVIQYTAEFGDEKDADSAVLDASSMDGFVAGRSVPPGKGRSWSVQIFFKDAGSGVALPDGMRRVLTNPSMIKQLFQSRYQP